MTSIADISKSVQELAPAYAIESASVFGSCARGDANKTSDVDIALDTDDGFSLFDAARFRRQLSKALSRDVDVVSRKAATGALAENIEREQVLVYERA